MKEDVPYAKAVRVLMKNPVGDVPASGQTQIILQIKADGRLISRIEYLPVYLGERRIWRSGN